MIIKFKLDNLNSTSSLADILTMIAGPNMIILLNGKLGAGKTELTKLIGQKLEINETITSPSFVILNEYETNKSWKLIHMDAYRLNEKSNFYEYFELMQNNFTIIEWPKNLNFDFTKLKTITVNINFKNNQRDVELITHNLTTKENNTLEINLKKQFKI